MPVTAIKDTAPAGTISYGTVTFGVIRNYSLQASPIYDQAERTRTHTRYLLRVQGVIWADTVAKENAAMQTVQASLTDPRRRLVIEDIGFDSNRDIQFPGGNTPDVAWGPKPRLLMMEPVGGVLAWEIIWECEFSINRCPNTGMLNAMLAFNYETAYAINHEGLTTRTLSGYVQVPGIMTTGLRSPLPFSIDELWDSIKFVLPAGFRRMDAARKINDAKDRIDFVIVDTEFASEAFPQGIAEADLDYDFASRPPGFAAWTASLSGTITVAKGHPTWLAAQKFFLILFDKVGHIQNVVKLQGKGGTVIPQRLQFGYKLFSLSSRFSVQFLVTSCLNELLSSGGIWKPLNTNWTQWSASMPLNVANNRGAAGLELNGFADVIIDLCTPQQSVTIGDDSVVANQFNTPPKQTISCAGITQKNSYILFENKVTAVEEQNAVVHKLAQAIQTSVASPTAGAVGQILFGAPNVSGTDHTLQYQGMPDTYILMTGRALRLKFTPEVPVLTTVGGLPVEELGRNVEASEVTDFFGCPLYGLRWAVLYRVKGHLSFIETPKKPIC